MIPTTVAVKKMFSFWSSLAPTEPSKNNAFDFS